MPKETAQGNLIIFWDLQTFEKNRSVQKKHRLFIFTSTTALVLTSTYSKASAQGIFGGARKAMECVISDASGSTGISNTLIQKLPGTIFTIITIVIFIYVLVQITRSFQAAQQGNEVSSLLIPPVVLMAGLVVIGFMQNLLFGNGAC